MKKQYFGMPDCSILKGKQLFPFVNYIVSFTENTDFSYLHDEKELELHIWRIWSTDQYYNLVQYYPQTPSNFRDIELWIFCGIGDL